MTRVLQLITLSLAIFIIWDGGASAYGRDVIRHLLADGFDYPVGKPDASGYYKARGYRPNGHLGEDWNGVGGGDSDLGDPIYSIAHGVVVLSADMKKGWGNSIIVRHAYRDASGQIRYVDSQYTHLLKRYVKLHERVVRGQQIGTMGSNRGMYPAHLHFEMRKELRLGMDRSKWPRNNSTYYDPTSFIVAHRRLRASNQLYPIPVNTFEGQENLGTDPRIKGLQVPVSQRSLQPIEERPDSGVASSTVKDILSEIQKNKKSESDEKPSSWKRFRDRLNGKQRG